MFPFINIFGTQIHMTGVGVVVFLLVFLFRTRKYITKFQGDWSVFWKLVPTYLVIIYLASSWSWYAIEEFIFIPTSIDQFMAYISPFEYKFHLIGMIGSIGWCVWHFFQKIRDTNMQLKRIDAWFMAAMQGVLFLGIFLLLGDTFIGEPTDTGIFVSAFQADSKVATFNTVIPLGLYLSFIALVLFIGTKILRHNKTQLRGYGLIGWIIFLVLFSFLILYQEYARRLVFKLLGKTWDMRNIALLLSAAWLVRKYKTKYEFFSQLR